MKKIIVVSDTHGSAKGLDKLRPLIAENDMVIHLGDGVNDIRPIFSKYPEKVYAVSGNCDFSPLFPQEEELDVESVRIFICHGHKYGVKSGLGVLAAQAKRRGCALVFYGHTHQASVMQIDGVTLINPGTLRCPAGEGGSYAYVVIHGRKITPVIVGENVY